MKELKKHNVSVVMKSGSIIRFSNAWVRNLDDWALEFFDGTESTIISKDEIRSIVLRPSTEDDSNE